jgi:hypothetical protein
MRRRVTLEVLVVLLAATLGVVGSVLTGLAPFLRLGLCLPLILFTPGYALVRAAAPRAPLSLLARFVMGLGTSMAIAALSGLFLNAFPAGMTSATWTAFLFTITVVCCVILVLRSWGRNAATLTPERPPVVRTPLRGRRLSVSILLFAVSLSILIVAFGVATQAFYGQPRPGFAQLWILPGSDPSSVALGVRNDEGRPIEGTVTLTRDGQVEAQWPSISLNDGDVWQAAVEVPDFLQGDEPLQATLTLADSPDTVYRYVTLWPSTSRIAGS